MKKGMHCKKSKSRLDCFWSGYPLFVGAIAFIKKHPLLEASKHWVWVNPFQIPNMRQDKCKFQAVLKIVQTLTILPSNCWYQHFFPLICIHYIHVFNSSNFGSEMDSSISVPVFVSTHLILEEFIGIKFRLSSLCSYIWRRSLVWVYIFWITCIPYWVQHEMG